MNYYSFNIGDYRRDTTHLSRLEHSIYRDLIDWYYLDENPIPLETQVVSRRLRLATDEEAMALESVISDFFERTDDGYRHGRIDEDIAIVIKAKANHWGRKLTKSQRCAIQANRNAAKVSASPRWLSVEQKMQIAEIYAACALRTAETGVKHEVDHIIPLRNKSVCGLHVPWNLQVIPAHKNRSKSNSFEASK